MRRYVRPLALTALLLISWLSDPQPGSAQIASRAKRNAESRDRLVTSIVEDGSGGSIFINTAGKAAVAPPAVRFYPGDNGESVMVADFAGVNWQQASRVFYPTGGGVRKVRVAQVQNRPAIFRLVLSADSPRVFKKVEFATGPGGLVVKLPQSPKKTPASGAQTLTLGAASVRQNSADVKGWSSQQADASAIKSKVPMSALPAPLSARSKLPPVPPGGLVLDLKADGYAMPPSAPQIVTASNNASNASSANVKPSADPNKPTLRGPIVVDTPIAPEAKSASEVKKAAEVKKAPDLKVAPEVRIAPELKKSPESKSAPEIKNAPEVKKTPKPVVATQPGTSTAVPPVAPPVAPLAAGRSPTPASSFAGKKTQIAARKESPEVVEVVPGDEPPMLPGLASIKKIVQISSANKMPVAAQSARRQGDTAGGALAQASGGEENALPPPPAPSAALVTGKRNVSEEDSSAVADLAPDIVSAAEIKVLSTEPLRFAVSSQGKTLKAKSFRLHDPERHVIDVENASELASATMPVFPENAFVKNLRLGSPDGQSGRIVLDLSDDETAVFEKCDESGNLIIDVMKESQVPFTAAARLPGGSTIVLDAGHGGTDPGAQRGDIQEKEITLQIVEKLRKILRRQGARVVMTRSDDTFVSLEDRVRITNETAPNAFVSVHINSLESNNSITGIETYYLHPQSRALAHSIHGSLVSKLGVPDRNVRTARFYVVNHTPYPAILAEVGFISNKEERDKLISSDYQQKVAEALAQGVIVYVANHKGDASGTIAVAPPSITPRAKRFTQILQAKKPSRLVRPTKIAMARRKAKKSKQRIAIAHRSVRSKRSR